MRSAGLNWLTWTEQVMAELRTSDVTLDAKGMDQTTKGKLTCGCDGKFKDWPGHDSGPILIAYEVVGPNGGYVDHDVENCLVEAMRWVHNSSRSDNTNLLTAVLFEGGEPVPDSQYDAIADLWDDYYDRQDRERQEKRKETPRVWMSVTHPTAGVVREAWIEGHNKQWYRDQFERFGCTVEFSAKNPKRIRW